MLFYAPNCHTDHTDTIVSSMACIFDVKNGKLIKNRYLSVGYGLGMMKIEAFDNSHQTVRVCYTDLTDSFVSSMACIVDVKK